jgi:hypothetical protein
MITNIVKNKKNYFTANYYDAVSDAIRNNSFSIKSDSDIYIEVGNTIDKLEITFSTLELQDFKYFEYLYNNTDYNYFTHYKLEYSLDMCNWTELNWKSMLGTNDLNEAITYYYNTQKYVNDLGETIQVFLRFTDLNDLSLYEIETDQSILNAVATGGTYVYTRPKLNTINETEYLYQDLKFRYFRCTFFNIQTPTTIPFVINKFQIYSDETPELPTDRILELTASNYSQQRFFEDNEFLPIQIKTYLQMLESNDDQHDFNISMNVNMNIVGIGDMYINSKNPNIIFIVG